MARRQNHKPIYRSERIPASSARLPGSGVSGVELSPADINASRGPQRHDQNHRIVVHELIGVRVVSAWARDARAGTIRIAP